MVVFLWKNIGPGYVAFANVLVQMHGGSSGSTPPGMAVDNCISPSSEELTKG